MLSSTYGECVYDVVLRHLFFFCWCLLVFFSYFSVLILTGVLSCNSLLFFRHFAEFSQTRRSHKNIGSSLLWRGVGLQIVSVKLCFYERAHHWVYVKFLLNSFLCSLIQMATDKVIYIIKCARLIHLYCHYQSFYASSRNYYLSVHSFEVLVFFIYFLHFLFFWFSSLSISLSALWFSRAVVEQNILDFYILVL